MSSNYFSASDINTYFPSYDFTWEARTNKADSSMILCTAHCNFNWVDSMTLNVTLEPGNLCPKYTVTVPQDVYDEKYRTGPTSWMSSSSGDDWIFIGNIDLTSYDGDQVMVPERLRDNSGKQFAIIDLDDSFCEDLSVLISNTVYSLEHDLREEYSWGISVNDLGFYSYQ